MAPTLLRDGPFRREAEVAHISPHGFWMLLRTEELLVPFTEFPWFKKATVEQITQVERPTSNHLYWPLLHVDLSVDALRDPAAFPLVSRANSAP
jgi:hypothetical protein